MTEDARERIADARDDADRTASRYERAAEKAVPVSAEDGSGTVRVQLDAHGVLSGVAVAEAWRTALGPDALAGAVLEAYARAGAERARGWGNEVADALEDPSPTLRPAPLAHESLAGRLAEVVGRSGTPAGGDAATEGILEMFRDIERGIDQVFGDVDGRLAARHEGYSAAGHVTAVVSGVGEVVSLEYEERWLTTAHGFNIGRETTEAVRDGLRRVGSTDSAALLQGTSLEKWQRLAEDPRALARHLGIVE